MGLTVNGTQKNSTNERNFFASAVGNLLGYVVYPLKSGAKLIESYSQNKIVAIGSVAGLTLGIDWISASVAKNVYSLIAAKGDENQKTGKRVKPSHPLTETFGHAIYFGCYAIGLRQVIKHINFPLSNRTIIGISLTTLFAKFVVKQDAIKSFVGS